MENDESEVNPGYQVDTVDFCPTVVSFTTDHCSVYEKLADGTFRRHKYDGTDYEPMEWTMFTDIGGYKDMEMALV